MADQSQKSQGSTNRVRIVVATSVMLTFISFWRAAAIVLNDLGSSAFYAAGIAEQAIGKAAPWFVLGVMAFATAVRAVYVESCSMFVRGGVYRVVKTALGGTLAKVSVSALMFDYILTGPISGVSAGHYISELLKELLELGYQRGVVPWHIPINTNWMSVAFAVGVTIFYWWENTKGLEESSEKALRVMQITTVMVVILLGWSAITLLVRGGAPLPPAPVPSNLHFDKEALGWIPAEWPQMMGLLGIMMAFGHSVLAMSGEESLAQVNREIAHPKLLNLKRAAIIIGIFSLVFTGMSGILGVMIIPDDVRAIYKDNLIAGIAMYLAGPDLLRFAFRIFVVFVGFLMLSGAVNTAIIGSNGVLNRVSEDGVLTDWFRKPHKRFGTSYRIINLVVGLQLFTIIASRGDVFVLGEAYAFGVIWSFTFNSLAMLVLRFKYKGERGWKMPPNVRIGNIEIPLGLLGVHLVLVSTAIVNLFTKRIATVAGLVFATTFFIIFYLSEKANKRKFAAAEASMKEQFQLQHAETVHHEAVGIKPGNILVTLRDYNTLNHLRWVLERTDTDEQDVVCMAARVTRLAAGGYDLAMEQIFSDYEQTLFTRAVSIAEKYGKHISLLVVPAADVWSAIVQTANNLESSAVVAGLSSKMTAPEQAFRLGSAWESAPEPKRQFVLQIVRPDMQVETFRIGPHTPEMKTEDVLLVHRLWLHITKERGLDKLHHSDIVTVALTRFARDFGMNRDDILSELRKIEDKRFGGRPKLRGDLSQKPVLPAPTATPSTSEEPPVLGP